MMPKLSNVSWATERPATRIEAPPIAYGNGGRRLMIDTPGRPPTSCVFAVEVAVSYKDDDGRSILLLQLGSWVVMTLMHASRLVLGRHTYSTPPREFATSASRFARHPMAFFVALPGIVVQGDWHVRHKASRTIPTVAASFHEFTVELGQRLVSDELESVPWT